MSEEREDGPQFSINDILGTLQRRKWVIIQAFVFMSVIGVVTASLSPNVYSTQASLLVETPQNVLLMQNSGDGPLSPLLMMRSRQSLETQLAILRSGEFYRRVLKRVGGTTNFPQLGYVAQPETSIIQISAQGPDAKAAAAWANAAADEYRVLTTESNKGALQQSEKFFEKMTDLSGKRLRKAEEALLSFKQRTRLVDDNEAAGDEIRRAGEMQTQYYQAATELLGIEANIAGLKARLKSAPAVMPESKSVDNPEYRALYQELGKLKAENAILKTKFAEGSVTLTQKEDEIKSVEEALKGKPAYIREVTERPNPYVDQWTNQLAELELRHATQVAQVERLKQVAGQGTSRAALVAPWQVEGERIQRELDQALKENLDYGDKLRQLRMGTELRGATAQVMEVAAVPPVPIGPQRTQQVVLSMMFGLLLGVGFAFLQEFLDDRVNTSEDIERVASLATLGVVPTIPDENNRLLIGQDAFSPITESYRALRTAVQYSYVDHKVNALAVTSAHPGEGKSVTSANLAIAMALQGKRVILVDADLRRPSVHRMFRVEAEPGLTSVLAGEISLDDALHSTAIEGFKVLTAGPLPPNPPELLNSQAMMDLLEKFKDYADLVVFDTPPTIPVTDAQVLASHVDGVVLVVEAGQSRKATVKHARDLLERTHGRLLGVVLNKIDQSAKGYYYHYYYRGGYRKYRKYDYGKRYGYGKGYGGGEQYGYGQYGYGKYGQGQYGYGGSGYGYSGARHRLGGVPEEDARPVGVHVSDDEPMEEKRRLPERLRDWE